GFAVGPRLNAAGRMDDMTLGIECLLAPDPARARQLAQLLDRFNQSRRETESLMHEEALLELEQQGELAAEALPVGLALYRPGWHQGVIGILASRLKERYHRPVIIFAQGGEGELKGSARSIPGLHIRDLLDAMATAQPDLIRRFGGHAMAAGLSIADGDYSRFATLFDQTARQWIAPEVLEGIVLSDGILPVAALTLEVARQLRYGGPWGQHFPEPLFEGEFELLQRRIVGGHHLKMLLASAEGGEPLDAIAFRFDLDQLEQLPNRLRLAYRLDLNRYRGETRLQLVVEHWEAT
ncbi:MAG TPA: DHHA1 domain-containing protein, partial [Pseudomonadales bacterium]|nr:DHHA1 domain-containing protein [Pseudomonadales bacterium]